MTIFTERERYLVLLYKEYFHYPQVVIQNNKKKSEQSEESKRPKRPEQPKKKEQSDDYYQYISPELKIKIIKCIK